MVEVHVKLHESNRPESPNVKRHHMKAYIRNKKLGQAIRWAFIAANSLQDARSMLETCQGSHESKRSLFVKICYIRPRMLDSDNLIAALKHTRDTIADLLIPGLEKGRADGDPRILWHCEQKKGEPKIYALIITIDYIYGVNHHIMEKGLTSEFGNAKSELLKKLWPESFKDGEDV